MVDTTENSPYYDQQGANESDYLGNPPAVQRRAPELPTPSGYSTTPQYGQAPTFQGEPISLGQFIAAGMNNENPYTYQINRARAALEQQTGVRAQQAFPIEQEQRQASLEGTKLTNVEKSEAGITNILNSDLNPSVKKTLLESRFAAADNLGFGERYPADLRAAIPKMTADELAGLRVTVKSDVDAQMKALPPEADTPQARMDLENALLANPHTLHAAIVRGSALAHQNAETRLKQQSYEFGQVGLNALKNTPTEGTTPTPPAQLSPSATPDQVPPSTERNQLQTIVAQKAIAAGVNPKTALAFLGNEGSGATEVSSKGAVGNFQIMPETARKYLPPSMQGLSTAQIQEALKNPALNHDVAMKLIKDLETQYPGRPDLQAAAYFSGPGNVKDGQIVDAGKTDGVDRNHGTTVQQYVDNFTRRFNGQALATTAGGSTTTPQTGEYQTQKNTLQKQITDAQGTIDKFGPYRETNPLLKGMVEKAEKDREFAQKQLEALNKRMERPTDTWVNSAHNELFPSKAAADLTSDQQTQVNKRAAELKAAAEAPTAEAANNALPVPPEVRDRVNRYRREQGIPELPAGMNQGQFKALPADQRMERKSFSDAPQKDQDIVRGAATILDDMKFIVEHASELKTGPITGRWEELKNQWGIQGNNTQAVLAAVLARLNNKNIHDFAGSAQGAQELKNIMTQLASLKDDPTAFTAKIGEAYQNLYQDQKRTIDAMTEDNISIPKAYRHVPAVIPPVAILPPAPAPSASPSQGNQSPATPQTPVVTPVTPVTPPTAKSTPEQDAAYRAQQGAKAAQDALRKPKP